MSKKTVKLIVVILIVALLPVLVMGGGHLYNNALLSGMEHDLTDTVSKGNVEMIESRSVCGKLNGNGNGMDFFAAVLVTGTELEVQAVVAALAQAYGDVGYLSQSEAKITVKYLEHESLSYSHKDYTDGEYYTVYIYDSDLPAFPMDLRGH